MASGDLKVDVSVKDLPVFVRLKEQLMELQEWRKIYTKLGCGGEGGWETGELSGGGNPVVRRCPGCVACNPEVMQQRQKVMLDLIRDFFSHCRAKGCWEDYRCWNCNKARELLAVFDKSAGRESQPDTVSVMTVPDEKTVNEVAALRKKLQVCRDASHQLRGELLQHRREAAAVRKELRELRSGMARLLAGD